MRVDGEEIIITAENAEEAIDNAVMNVLKDIKAEICRKIDEAPIFKSSHDRGVTDALNWVLNIINRHIKEKTQ